MTRKWIKRRETAQEMKRRAKSAWPRRTWPSAGRRLLVEIRARVPSAAVLPVPATHSALLLKVQLDPFKRNDVE